MNKDKLSNQFDFLSKSKIKAGDGLEEGKYPFYTSSENQTKYLDEFQHEPGCLVFGTGGKASVHYTTSRFATSTDCITIRPKSKAKIDAGYVFQYLKGNMQVLERGFKGAGLKHISKEYLSDIQIPHPSDLNDQKRIANLLGKVEGLIAQRKQHLQQLDALLKSVFLEMFGDPVRNEMGWSTEPLGKLATIERGRFSPRPRNDPKFYDGPYPFIQTGDISRSNGRLREYTQTLNELGVKVSKEFRVSTIVIAIVGATIGETAILQIPTYAPDSVIGITPKNGVKETESVFIEFLLRFWKPVLRARAPEAARANINIETLRPLPIIWPEGDDRKKFAATVEKVEGLKSYYQLSLTNLENLYGALSQKAFKGVLDLSRIPFELGTIKDSDSLETENTAIEASSDAPDNSAVCTPEGCIDFLQQCFSNWLAVSSHANLTFSDFVQEVQLDSIRRWGEDDFIADLTLAEYDLFKEWLFEAINTGRIKQTRNTIEVDGKPDFGNQIILRRRDSGI